jgi:1,5-anhydro-D-fructose reductase (1,5-anhydro-D-mannitol-forming)
MRSGTGTRGHVRWGIIGCGDVTEVKSGPAFRRVPGATLSSVSASSHAGATPRLHAGPRLRRAPRHRALDRRRRGGHRGRRRRRRLRRHAAIEPPRLRAAGRRGRQAGVRREAHGPRPRGGRGDGGGLRGRRVPLFVAYYRRAQPRFEFVRARLHDGSIGEPTLVQCELHQPAPVGPRAGRLALGPGGGRRWPVARRRQPRPRPARPLARPDRRGARLRRCSRLPWSRVADEVVGAFRFEAGAHGVGTWGFAGATRRDRITIVGTADASPCRSSPTAPSWSPTRAAPRPSTRSPIPPTSRSR